MAELIKILEYCGKRAVNARESFSYYLGRKMVNETK